MGNVSQPGSGVYVGAVCIVEAPENQLRNKQDLGCFLFLLRLILLNNTTASTPQAEFGCPDTKHIIGFYCVPSTAEPRSAVGRAPDS